MVWSDTMCMTGVKIFSALRDFWTEQHNIWPWCLKVGEEQSEKKPYIVNILILTGEIESDHLVSNSSLINHQEHSSAIQGSYFPWGQ